MYAKCPYRPMRIKKALGIFGRWKASLIATTVVLVVLILLIVTVFEKCLRNGKLRNFAHTFMSSFPTDIPSEIFPLNSYYLAIS